MPAFDWKHLDPYPEKYEARYNDHFMLRNRLIRNYAVYKLQFLRQSPFPEALIVGKTTGSISQPTSWTCTRVKRD